MSNAIAENYYHYINTSLRFLVGIKLSWNIYVSPLSVGGGDVDYLSLNLLMLLWIAMSEVGLKGNYSCKIVVRFRR